VMSFTLCILPLPVHLACQEASVTSCLNASTWASGPFRVIFLWCKVQVQEVLNFMSLSSSTLSLGLVSILLKTSSTPQVYGPCIFTPVCRVGAGQQVLRRASGCCPHLVQFSSCFPWDTAAPPLWLCPDPPSDWPWLRGHPIRGPPDIPTFAPQ
jgi:hypothetical protein